MDVCIGALTDEIKALILIISTSILATVYSIHGLWPYFRDTAMERNPHHLLTCKTSKWHSLFSLKMKESKLS